MMPNDGSASPALEEYGMPGITKRDPSGEMPSGGMETRGQGRDSEFDMPSGGMGNGHAGIGHSDGAGKSGGGGFGGDGGDGGDGSDMPQVRKCGTMEVHRRLLSTDPEYAHRRDEIEIEALRFETGEASTQRTGITRIPVVVHVVWNTTAQNISDAQIASQIDVLNRDFRRTNPDVSTTPAPFLSLATDARIEFFLATTTLPAHRPRGSNVVRPRSLRSRATTPSSPPQAAG